jgi:hypothetical protein
MSQYLFYIEERTPNSLLTRKKKGELDSLGQGHFLIALLILTIMYGEIVYILYALPACLEIFFISSSSVFAIA